MSDLDLMGLQLENLEKRVKGLTRVNLFLSISGPVALIVAIGVLIWQQLPREAITRNTVNGKTVIAQRIVVKDADGKQRILLDGRQARILVLDPKTGQELRLTWSELEFFAKKAGKLAALTAQASGVGLTLTGKAKGKQVQVRLVAEEVGAQLWLTREVDKGSNIAHMNSDDKTAEMRLSFQPKDPKRILKAPAVTAEASGKDSKLRVWGPGGDAVDLVNSAAHFGVVLTGHGKRICPDCRRHKPLKKPGDKKTPKKKKRRRRR